MSLQISLYLLATPPIFLTIYILKLCVLGTHTHLELVDFLDELEYYHYAMFPFINSNRFSLRSTFF